MRTRQPDCSPLYLKILFACIACPIMVWPILLRLYFELIELRARLVPVLAPFAKHSPNRIPAPNRFDFKHHLMMLYFSHLDLENTNKNKVEDDSISKLSSDL